MPIICMPKEVIGAGAGRKRNRNINMQPIAQ